MLKWEQIPQDQDGTLYRCKVPNGWLVKEKCITKDEHGFTNGFTSSIAFIPDSHYEWDINKESEVIETKEKELNKILNKIPKDLLTNFYLETTNNGEYSKKLKRYILDNCNPAEIHLLLNHFNLITTNIHI